MHEGPRRALRGGCGAWGGGVRRTGKEPLRPFNSTLETQRRGEGKARDQHAPQRTASFSVQPKEPRRNGAGVGDRFCSQATLQPSTGEKEGWIVWGVCGRPRGVLFVFASCCASAFETTQTRSARALPARFPSLVPALSASLRGMSQETMAGRAARGEAAGSGRQGRREAGWGGAGWEDGRGRRTGTVSFPPSFPRGDGKARCRNGRGGHGGTEGNAKDVRGWDAAQRLKRETEIERGNGGKGRGGGNSRWEVADGQREGARECSMRTNDG